MVFRDIDKKALIDNAATVSSKITIVGTDITFTEDDFISEWDYEDYRYVPENGFIGQFVERIFDGKLKDLPNDINIENKEINLQIGINNGITGETTYYDYGNFIVTKIGEQDTTGISTFESADYTKKFNAEYVDSLTYPCLALELANSACEQAGVELATKGYTYCYTVPKEGLVAGTYRFLIDNASYEFVISENLNFYDSIMYIVDEKRMVLKRVNEDFSITRTDLDYNLVSSSTSTELKVRKTGYYDFINNDFVIENNQFESTDTLREVIKSVAKLAYTWVRVGTDNKVYLDFKKKTSSSYGLTINGKSYQETSTQSANILDLTKLDYSNTNLVGFTINDLKTNEIKFTIDANNNWRTVVMPLTFKENGKYTYTFQASEDCGTNIDSYGRIYGYIGIVEYLKGTTTVNKKYENSNLGTTKDLYFNDFDVDTSLYDYALAFYPTCATTTTEPITFHWENLGILKGGDTYNHTYVDFTPNSPSPEYPSEIKNGDGATNLLYLDNVSGYKNGIYYKWEGTKLTLNGTATANTDIYNFGYWGSTQKHEKRLIKPGTYTLSIKDKSHLQRFSISMYYDTTTHVIGIHNSHDYDVVKTFQNEVYYSNCYASIVKGVTFENETFYLQLEKGDRAHDYVPYGRWLSIRTNSDNLANTYNINRTTAGLKIKSDNEGKMFVSGTATATYGTVKRIDYVKPIFKKGDKVSMSWGSTKDLSQDTLGNPFVWFRNKSGAAVSSLAKQLTTTTINDDIYYIFIGVENYVKGSSYDESMYMSLVKSTTKPEVFEPYKENTALIDMNIYDEEGNIIGYRELCAISDVKDTFKDGVLTQRIGKVVLDGSETWTQNSGKTCFYLSNSNVAITNEINKATSTHYETNNFGMLYGGSVDYGVSLNESASRIVIRHKDITDIDTFKAYLKEQYDAGTPVIVEYTLATPIEHTLNYETLELFDDANNISFNDDLITEDDYEFVEDKITIDDYYETEKQPELYGPVNKVLLGMSTIDGENAYKAKLVDEIESISIDGKSFQETRSGKNILDYVNNVYATRNGITNVINDDGSVTTSGVPTADWNGVTPRINITDILEDGATYVMSQTPNTYVFLEARAWEISSNTIKSYYSPKTGDTWFKVDKSLYRYDICILSTTMSAWGTESRTITNFYQLEKGSTVTEFEKYGASPSPDYPSEIKNVEGVTNLFNGVTTNELVNDSGTISNNNAWSLSDYIEVEPNEVYTFSRQLGTGQSFIIAEYDENKTFIKRNVQGSSSSLYPYTITTSATTKYVRLNYNNTHNGDLFAFIKGTNTDYVPYGRWLEVKSVGKNLFNENEYVENVQTSNYSEYNGKKCIQIYAVKHTMFEDFKPNTQYVISYEILHRSNKEIAGIIIHYDDGTEDSDYNLNVGEKTFITKPNKNVRDIYFNGWSSGHYLMLTNIQVIEGTHLTEYEPYKENTALIDLNIYDEEGNITGHYELCAIGDTKDTFENGVLTQRISKVVLDGSEVWKQYPTQTLDNTSFFAYESGLKFASVKNLYCSHFQFAYIWGNDVVGIYLDTNETHTDNLRIRIPSEKASTIEEFKNWLKEQYEAGTPVIIEYQLATPIEHNMHYQELELHEGYNNITTNDELEPNMSIDVSDIDNNVTTYSGNTITAVLSNNKETSLQIWDNPLTYTEDLRKIALNGSESLFGVRYTPMTTQTVGHPWLEASDYVKLTNLSNQTLYTYPLDRKLSYKGYIKSDISSKAPTLVQQQYEFNGDTDTKLTKTQISVDKANQRITAVASDISDTNEKVSQLTITTGEIKTEVGQKATKIELNDTKTELNNNINTAVDNIEVGGRNLFVKKNLQTISVDSWVWNGYTLSCTCSKGSAGPKFNASLFTVGEIYTLSFKFKKTSGTLKNIGGHNNGFRQQAFYVDGVKVSSLYIQGHALNDTTDTHNVSVTLEYRGTDSVDNNLYIQVNRGLSATPANFDIWDIKLEKGNKPTDWTPAPEDVDSNIDKAKNDAITTANTNTDNKLKNYSTTTEMNSAITQKADSILSTVSTTYTTKTESANDIANAVNNIDVGGRNYILNGSGKEKKGFFTKFNLNEGEEYCEYTLTSKNTYTNVNTPGYVLGCRDYEVGSKVVFSYDIMYTKWDFPEGTTRTEFWMGQRYTSQTISGGSTSGVWKGVTQHDLPVVGQNGCELNQWFHVEKIITIPTQAAEGIGAAESIQFYNSNANIAASVTFKLKNIKLEYGNKATDWTPAPEDVDNKFKNYSTTTEMNSAIDQKAGSITSTVSATYITKTDSANNIKNAINDIEIGGTNLWTGTKDFSTDAWLNTTYWLDSDEVYKGFAVKQRTGAWQGLSQDIEFNVGDVITFSGYVKKTAGAVFVYTGYGTGKTDKDGVAMNVANNDEWTYFNATFKVTTAGTIRCRVENNTSDATIYVCGLKLEKGNKATDWTPALTDQDAEVIELKQKVTTLEQTSSSFNITISELSTFKTDTESALEGINSDITDVNTELGKKQSAEDVAKSMESRLEQGVSKVITKTGYSFTQDGLVVSKTGSEMSTVIDEDGMTINRSGNEVLVADHDGVVAYNLHANTYLLVGTNSRFENYTNDNGEARTGCFWIG